MNFDTETTARYAGEQLALLLERQAATQPRSSRKTTFPPPSPISPSFSDAVDHLRAMISALEKHVDGLSYEILPTMIQNQNVKSLNLENVGRVTVNVRWNATMIDKVREHGMDAHSRQRRLDHRDGQRSARWTSFAKAETLAGRPLPDDLFKVGTAPYISITPTS